LVFANPEGFSQQLAKKTKAKGENRSIFSGFSVAPRA
jgi:hypothetical protein